MPASVLPYVPRLPADILRREDLLARLDGPAALVVVCGRGGSGKTTLLAQWARETSARGDGSIVWLEADEGARTRAGFWLRVLGRMHAQRLISDAVLYREMATIAEQPDTAVTTTVRILEGLTGPVTLLLDDVGSSRQGTYWDQVCLDLIEVVRRSPRFRCIVAGRFPTELSGPAARSAVSVDVISEGDLALSDEEVHEVVPLFAPDLSQDVLAVLRESSLIGNPVSRRFAALRFSLDALSQTSEGGRGLTELSLESLLVEAARKATRGLFRDPSLREFMLVTAQSPLVDVDLARSLTGRDDALAMFHELERLGAGQWEESEEGGAPVFRYTEHLQAAAAQEFRPGDRARRRDVDLRIAHWLADVRGEHLAAFERALRAEDLSFAETLLMRAYPLPKDEAVHVTALLSKVPASKLSLHPMLSMWVAVTLNMSAGTQRRAAVFFEAATSARMHPARPGTDLERALLRGVQSAAQRLLGHDRGMRELALSALPVLEGVADDPLRDVSFDGMTMAAIAQCGMGLFYAGEFERARDARSLQIRFAESLSWLHHRNVALANIAMIDAISGEIGAAQDALVRMDPEDWPDNWEDSYMASPEHIARAWIAVSQGRPEGAITEIDRISGHLDSIEHWELVGEVRAMALTMLGRGHEALETFRRLAAERVNERTLRSVSRRFAAFEGILLLSTGAGLQSMARTSRGHDEPVSSALDALVALEEGRQEDMLGLLAEAQRSARTTSQRMLVGVIELIISAQPDTGLDLVTRAQRIGALLAVSALRWPLALAPEAVRATTLEELRLRGEKAALSALEQAFGEMPSIVDDEVFRRRGPSPRLTRRERAVLWELAETGSRHEIAVRLHVSENTVKSQLRAVYAKLGARTREEALARAIELGVLRTPLTDQPRAGLAERS